MSRRIETAFVLGAGLGKRLRPLTESCPKPLLPIDGRPMITHAFDHLIGIGIQRIIINTHHCPEKYTESFPDQQWRGVPLTFCYEPVLLETAGGLKNIENLLNNDERIIMYNGDILTDLPLQKLCDFHQANSHEVSLALRSEGGAKNIALDSQGIVRDVRHALDIRDLPQYVFTGISVVEKSFLRRLEKDKIESVADVWIRMLQKQEYSLGGILLDEGQWCDLGTLAQYEEKKKSWKMT